jgi:hypothetical protein
MVHVWEDDPNLPEIKWTQHARQCALAANQTPWIRIWQFDFVNAEWYKNNVWNHNQLPNWNQHLQTAENGLIPHRNVLIKNTDWVTTSNEQTKMIVKHLDPRLVLFGGLHKDLCVRGVLLSIKDSQREYAESDLLSYTWKDTLKKVQDYEFKC